MIVGHIFDMKHFEKKGEVNSFDHKDEVQMSFFGKTYIKIWLLTKYKNSVLPFSQKGLVRIFLLLTF